MDETFSSIDLITQCLTDEKRTKAFRQGIEKAVKPGDVVLDAGTGSGILALCAARAGAKKVIAVEYDPYVAQLARENFRRNGYEDVIQLIVGDARMLELQEPTQFGGVIMEMLTTGMVDEYQVWAINNLHEKGYVKDTTVYVPGIQETYVSLAHMNFEVEGLDMRMVRHLWEPFPVGEMTEMTERTLLNAVSFDRRTESKFAWKQQFKVGQQGVINSLYITSDSILAEGVRIADTLSLNAPVVLPLPEDVSVAAGDTVECEVRYQFGNGYRNFEASVVLI